MNEHAAPASAHEPRFDLGRGLLAIILRDLKRYWADRIRVVTGLIQPLLYLFVLGSGISATSRLGGGYLPFIFPGVIGLSLLFAATFSGVSIVFDREWGFLKAVLVAPVSRREIALGKVLSGALQGLVQGTLLLLFAPLAGLRVTPLALLELALSMVLAGLVFSAMGVAIAARFKSAEVFPIIMNAVLLPFFFASGALFPLDVAPRWLQIVAYVDPVAYGVDLMRGALIGQYHFHPALSLAVLFGGLLALTWASVRAFEKGEEV